MNFRQAKKAGLEIVPKKSSVYGVTVARKCRPMFDVWGTYFGYDEVLYAKGRGSKGFTKRFVCRSSY